MDIEGNPLVENEKYIITNINGGNLTNDRTPGYNVKYIIGTYLEIDTENDVKISEPIFVFENNLKQRDKGFIHINKDILNFKLYKNTSVLGSRTTTSRDDIEEQERKRLKKEQDKKMMKASHFLHEMKDKVRNGYTISDIEYENIHKALTIIPEEEHYRWANVLESLNYKNQTLYLDDITNKIDNDESLSNDEYENIHKALTIIRKEEHYKWPKVLENFKKYIEEKYKEEEDEQKETEEIEEDKKFWESVDGGSRRKGSRSKKRKSKRNKRKSKRRKSNNSI